MEFGFISFGNIANHFFNEVAILVFTNLWNLVLFISKMSLKKFQKVSKLTKVLENGKTKQRGEKRSFFVANLWNLVSFDLEI